LTRRFPDLTAAVAGLEPRTLILDGEIAVFDRQLISRFEWLRGRPKDDTATPPIFIAFDCLFARGKDLRERALRLRRNVLDEIVDGQHLLLPARRLNSEVIAHSSSSFGAVASWPRSGNGEVGLIPALGGATFS